jgi:hypothetical protein
MKCEYPNCTEPAEKRNRFCMTHIREMSKQYNDAGLHLQPVAQWQPPTSVQRKRGVDYRGSVK